MFVRVGRLSSAVRCQQSARMQRFVHSSAPICNPVAHAEPANERSNTPIATAALSNPETTSAKRRRRRRGAGRFPPVSSYASLGANDELIFHSSSADQRPFNLHTPAPFTQWIFRITHANKEYIHEAAATFEDTCMKMKLYIDSVVPLPITYQKFTFLRSPHVDKTSREQYAIVRHKRIISIVTDTWEEEKKIPVLNNKLVSLPTHDRVTMNKHFPANTPIQTVTFAKQIDTIHAKAIEPSDDELYIQPPPSSSSTSTRRTTQGQHRNNE